ncbi:hypothetical protein BCR44DRAFT_1251454 [Catenaria anguillulae PL171]|uniref:Uncharacterized protein n=1 Tax=Catenaria anguillulae PL171 TaxID=765915 RepID=A0A1Y2I0X4_9FUNG|nr:hypothetical protein BCR44DRAFT_1251454 [Catenaria anguillulae PL171]
MQRAGGSTQNVLGVPHGPLLLARAPKGRLASPQVRLQGVQGARAQGALLHRRGNARKVPDPLARGRRARKQDQGNGPRLRGVQCARLGGRHAPDGMLRRDRLRHRGRLHPMSMSRDHCPRSHSRYTLCGTHGNGERDCETNKDWRNCHACLIDILHGHQPLMAFSLWKGINCWNVAPMLARDVPRHALCDVCRDCGQKFVAGVTGATYTRSGSIICTKCNPTSDPRASGPVFSTLMI